MSDTSAPVEVGQVLDQKYRVDRILGVGGMGVVVAATHVNLDERVAIKFLLPEARDNPEVVARFAREARAAAKIKGEHVARVSDVGTLSTGEPYMVMEYLQGNDLAAEVQKGPLSVERTVSYVLQACEALAEAHLLGIIHRDIKPANLFLTRRPDGTDCIKVLDFGISKVSNPGASDVGMTKTQSAMGSPLYMSPEQMTSSKNVDARADIWSMGVVLHELLSGASPFLGETLPEVCARILQDTPSSLVPLGVPAELDAVVQRCLQKPAGARFSSMAELAAALVPFAGPDGRVAAERIQRLQGGAERAPASTAVATPPRQPAAPALTAATDASVEKTVVADGRGPSRTPLVVALGALALVGAVGVGMALQGSRGQAAEALAASPVPSAYLAPSAAVAPSAQVVALASASVSASSPVETPPPVKAVAGKAGAVKTKEPAVPAPPANPPPPTKIAPPADRRGDDRH